MAEEDPMATEPEPAVTKTSATVLVPTALLADLADLDMARHTPQSNERRDPVQAAVGTSPSSLPGMLARLAPAGTRPVHTRLSDLR